MLFHLSDAASVEEEEDSLGGLFEHENFLEEGQVFIPLKKQLQGLVLLVQREEAAAVLDCLRLEVSHHVGVTTFFKPSQSTLFPLHPLCGRPFLFFDLARDLGLNERVPRGLLRAACRPLLLRNLWHLSSS